MNKNLQIVAMKQSYLTEKNEDENKTGMEILILIVCGLNGRLDYD